MFEVIKVIMESSYANIFQAKRSMITVLSQEMVSVYLSVCKLAR